MGTAAFRYSLGLAQEEGRQLWENVEPRTGPLEEPTSQSAHTDHTVLRTLVDLCLLFGSFSPSPEPELCDP